MAKGGACPSLRPVVAATRYVISALRLPGARCKDSGEPKDS